MRISDSHSSRARENESFLAVDGCRRPQLIEHGARLNGSHRLIIRDGQGRTVRAESFHNLVTTAGWTEVTAGQVQQATRQAWTPGTAGAGSVNDSAAPAADTTSASLAGTVYIHGLFLSEQQYDCRHYRRALQRGRIHTRRSGCAGELHSKRYLHSVPELGS
jgi:hypothetical protein